MLSLRGYVKDYLDGLYLRAFGKLGGELPSLLDVARSVMRVMSAHSYMQPPVNVAAVTALSMPRPGIHYRASFYWLVSDVLPHLSLEYSAPDLATAGDPANRSVSVSDIVPSESGLSQFSIEWSNVLIPPGD